MAYQNILYVEKESIIHKLHPSLKLILFLISFLVAVYTQWNGLVALIAFTSPILMSILAKLPKSRYAIIFGYTGIIATIALIVWSMIIKGEIELLKLGPLIITYEGLIVGIGKAILIITPVITGIVILSTTKSYDLMYSICKLFKLSYKIPFIFILSFRLMNITLNEVKTIIEAQTLRGIDFKKGPLSKRIRNYISIFIPLFVRVIDRIPYIALSMETRGFGIYKSRTFYKTYRLSKLDFYVTIILLTPQIIAIYLNYIGWGLL